MQISNDSIHALITDLGVRARAASRSMARASSAAKDAALLELARLIRAQATKLKAANAPDV